MKLWLALLFPLLASAAETPDWLLTDLSAMPELASFFADADAVITVKKKHGDDPQAIKPTVFVFKIQRKPSVLFKTNAEWLDYLKAYIKDPKRVVLGQTTKPGRTMLEFTSRHEDSASDLRSLYLAYQNPDKSVVLFVYDGVGPATARNLPLVRQLLTTMEQPKLMEMYRADVNRRGSN